MDKLPRDELAERPAQFWRIQQCARVDLDIGSGGHPVVEQGGVFEDVGVSLDVGDEGQNTLLLQEGEGLPDEMGLVGSGKLHQHIRGIADAERLGIQLTELGGEVDFTAQLEAELHGFRSGRKRGCQCLIGGRTLLQECIGSRPLTVEVARKSNVPHTVCILFFQQTKGDRNIFGTIVNVRKDMAMKVCHASSSVCTECFSLPLCCSFDVRPLFLAADFERPWGSP